MASSALLCLLVPCFSTNAKAFLGSSPAMSVEEMHQELAATDPVTVDGLERALAPMYVTLPKNIHGRICHATVCYALHHFFVQQYGWFINGLAPDGSGWNSSSA